MTTKISVAEIFHSIQGEGPTTGRRAVFLRLAGCNLLCGGDGIDGAKWRCDTIEVWQRGRSYDVESFVQHFTEAGFLKHLHEGSHLIITGGEPLLQAKALKVFLEHIKSQLFYVEMETNGTIVPKFGLDIKIDQYNVSPKLKNSGMSVKKRINPEALDKFAGMKDAFFKFVICHPNDIVEVLRMKDEYIIPSERIWLMPGASTRQYLVSNSEWIAKAAITHRFNFSSRLQLSIWDKATGV